MPTAIHYNSVHTPEARTLFGIEVAVLQWLEAFFRYGRQEKFPFLIADSRAKDEIEEITAKAGLDPARLQLLDRRAARENLARFETVFRADLHAGNLLWQRQGLAPGFAFCSLSHAVSGIEGGKLLEHYCLAPTENSDAIVCPSRAIANVIRTFWDIYGDYLKHRFGVDFKCPVQLPVIPLGLDVETFAARATPEKRDRQRHALGLGENEIALLWVGRLSHAIKAHPLAMFQAAERAAELTGAAVRLVMQGYFVPPEAEGQFRKLAQDICHKATVTFIANDDARFPDGLWAAGDIFFSLIDNMQESFGLTPIEAMAAGLPRVVSDWDGYRDSVVDGEDGFLIPTRQPPPGAGGDLAALLRDGREIYGGFLGKTSLSVAIDSEAAARAIALLIENKDRRAAMVAKARARAQAVYDWRHIIPAYESLWEELAAKRCRESRPAVPPNWPLVPDPFTLYAGYASAPLKESDRLAVALPAETIKMLLGHDINLLALDMMIAPDRTTALINHIAAQGPLAIGALFAAFPDLDRAALWRTLGWLLKLAILRVP
ncbi:MAG TPA: glycosyltransferase family 4 protein [Alphaproteobacteria bacterium]|nr:glycosyltransferase family 4 protein [Alphaproteobacteria bacterium]